MVNVNAKSNNKNKKNKKSEQSIYLCSSLGSIKDEKVLEIIDMDLKYFHGDLTFDFYDIRFVKEMNNDDTKNINDFRNQTCLKDTFGGCKYILFEDQNKWNYIMTSGFFNFALYEEILNELKEFNKNKHKFNLNIYKNTTKNDQVRFYPVICAQNPTSNQTTKEVTP